MYSYIFSLAALGLAHCCTIFLKSSGYQNIDDIDDRHRNLCKYQYQRDHLVGQSTHVSGVFENSQMMMDLENVILGL